MTSLRTSRFAGVGDPPRGGSDNLVGKSAVLQVKLDPGVRVWGKNFTKAYPIRVTGERTMCPTPALEAQDEVNFVIESPEPGKSIRITGLSVTK